MVSFQRKCPEVFQLLNASALMRTYRNAFEAATGLPLVLVRQGNPEESAKYNSKNSNPFCELIRSNEATCAHCIDLNRRLQKDARDGAASLQCFAGLTETMVPVVHDGEPIAFLKTGEIRNREISGEATAELFAMLKRLAGDDSFTSALRVANQQVPVVAEGRYEGVILLLETFAEQLGDHLREILCQLSEDEPEPVRKAVVYIRENIEDPISLEDTAKAAGISVSAFCRVFKASTGMTLTEYVNRKRIEWARTELLRKDSRVAEIAYKVGFSSLSQFNRTFARFVGKSPSEYRRLKFAGV